MNSQSIPPTTRLQRLWMRWCRFAVRVFYRRCEVDGLDHLPRTGPVMLCANHVNALADGALLQAISPRMLHPLARQGLFDSRLFRPLLRMVQAIPVARRKNSEEDPDRNLEAFASCYELFRNGGALLIFPEGQSHSQPYLSELKTGAARIALGALQTNGVAPPLVPVGLTFTRKGTFRGSVLVTLGPALRVTQNASENDYQAVERITGELSEALSAVTLNVSSWDDLQLLQQVERFFAFRGGQYRERTLRMRFRALKKLDSAYRKLREHAPEQLERLTRQMHRFDALCERFGVRDYQLTLRYTAGRVAIYMARSLAFLTFVLPLAAWGWLNNLIPFHVTRKLTLKLSQGRDQYDSAGILIGALLFPLLWLIQTFVAYLIWGGKPALLYLLSLIPTTAIAVIVRRQRRMIAENLRVFLLFIRRRDVRAYLEANRRQVEQELAQITRLARRLDKMHADDGA